MVLSAPGVAVSLYALKSWYTRRLEPVLGAAERARLSPDLFTVVGVLAAVAAGVAIAGGWWLLAALLLAARLAGANLDGALARRRGVARPWGFVLNELGDRASDVAMFAGLAVLADRSSDGRTVLLVLIAALTASLPTFASLALAGAGVRRINGGPLGKTERCLLAVLATAFPFAIDWVSMIVIVGSLLTVAARLLSGYRSLNRSTRRETPDQHAGAPGPAPAGVGR